MFKLNYFDEKNIYIQGTYVFVKYRIQLHMV